jgi:hypothetical protein
MGMLEAFLGASIAGFGMLLAVVAALAWRRNGDRKMAVLAAAFGVQAAGGAALLAGELLAGDLLALAPLLLGGAMLATLLCLYAALFARRA